VSKYSFTESYNKELQNNSLIIQPVVGHRQAGRVISTKLASALTRRSGAPEKLYLCQVLAFSHFHTAMGWEEDIASSSPSPLLFHSCPSGKGW